MKNPWNLEPDEVPDDAGIGRSDDGVRVLSTILWGNLLVVVGLLLVTDTATRSLAGFVWVSVSGGLSITLLVALVWVGYLVIGRFGPIGRVLLGVAVAIVLLLILPPAWQSLTERTDLLSELSDAVSLREPISDAIDGSAVERLLGALRTVAVGGGSPD